MVTVELGDDPRSPLHGWLPAELFKKAFSPKSVLGPTHYQHLTWERREVALLWGFCSFSYCEPSA
jgi:hypothetical protein